MGFNLKPMLLAAALTLIIWFGIPVPEGVAPNAWHLLALFIGVIVAIIGKAMPIGAISILAFTLVALTGVTADSAGQALKDSLSTLNNSLIWMIGIAIMISRGLSKTGLGTRIGYLFVSMWGKSSLGVAYSITVVDMLLAPVTPSNTARGGAIIHPIMRAIASSFDSDPEQQTEKKIGKYLALVNYHANIISCALFVTATASNPLAVELIAKATNSQLQISWGTWALAMIVPGIVAQIVMPLVLYFLFPPELKKTPEAPAFARQKLREMGPMLYGEKVMLGIFFILLVLWAGVPEMIFGKTAAVDATATAFIGLSLLLLSGVLTWDDVLKEKGAWDTIIWFAALVMMANFLNKLGLIKWFSTLLQTNIESLGLGWEIGCALLVLTYLYSHYAFASGTAHASAMFGAFYAAGLALGAPPMLFALIMIVAGDIMMCLTHYASGSSPVIYSSGYVTMGEWWKAGFIMSVISMAIWATVGIAWWGILGYY